MPGQILDKTASVWRFVNNPSGAVGQEKAQVYSAIRCAIVPLSRFDATSPYAYEATHVVWVPHWLALRKEDEVRVGRRPPDNFGDLAQYVFVVNGRRPFSNVGPAQVSYYAREKE